MKYVIAVLALLFAGVSAGAQTLSGVEVAPHGAVLASGTLQMSVTCQYTDGSSDNCAGKTVTWSSSQPSLDTVSSSGLATYVSNCGSAAYPDTTSGWRCWAHIVATVNGVSDYATIFNQYPGDTFQVAITPIVEFYNPTRPGTVVVGSTVTFGAGEGIDGSIANQVNANPFPGCNWTSSNTAVGTINRYGFFTAVAPGTATVTCVTAGNGAFTDAVTNGGTTLYTTPATFNVTVVSGGTGGHTWYVRPDGGTPYTNATDTPVGQCNGQANAPYPGSGVNQPCAFGDFEDLYFDQVTGKQQWVINGGDTVIVYPKAAGYNTAIITSSPVTPSNCQGDGEYCDVPTIPSGTTAQPTRILGSNYANCSASHGPNPAMTTLLLGYGREALRTDVSQNIDVECFEIADGSSTTGFEYGVWQSSFTANATFKNIFIHNATSAGVFGASGAGMTWDHLHIRAAKLAGFDMDDAPYGISNISVAGGLTLTNSNIEFTGCREIYGSTAEYPFTATGCTDQNTGGYGDGMGTGSMTGTWYYDNDIFRYNFQDGLDNLHSGAQSETVINSQAYGNDGQQFKFGDVDTGVFQNNLVLGNCNRIMQPFGGVTIANSGVVPCRAGGGAALFEWSGTGSYVFQNNTFVGVGNPVLLYECETTWTSCSTAKTTLQNNIFAGYTDNIPQYNSGTQPYALYQGTAGLPSGNAGWVIRSNNDFYNMTEYTPTTTAELALDPLFIGEPPFSTPLSGAGETVLDNYNFTPSAASRMLGAGLFLASLTTDANGFLRAIPPAIGALESTAGTTQFASQVTLSATPNPVSVGLPVTLSASVAAVNGAVPTGTMAFSSNGVSLGSAVLSNTGGATLTVPFPAAGSDAVTATYSGDTAYAPGQSPAFSLTVNAAPAAATTTTLGVSSSSVTAGQTVTLTATVAAASGGKPTGTVSFLSNGVTLGTASLNSAGVATFTTTSLASGSYTMTAKYGGSSSFSASTSSSLTETINAGAAAATTTTLGVSSTSVTAGQSITLAATVAAASGGKPTGTISFLSNGVTLGTASLNSAGVATFTTTSLASGSYTMTAKYGGSSSFSASTSSSLTETVNAAPAAATTTTLGVSSSSVTAGQTITLTATVAAASGGEPTGTVSFLSNGGILGAASLNSAGVATFTTAPLASGSYTMTTKYGGSTSFSASTSSPLTETVNAAQVAGISVAVSTPTLTIGSGSSTSDAEILTLTAVGGYSGTIQMVCANLPAGSTCAFQPPTVTVSSATGPVQVAMTIQSSASTTASIESNVLYTHDATLAGIFWIPGIFAAALIGKKRKMLRQPKVLLLLLLIGGVFGGLTGCGGASYSVIGQTAQTRTFQVMVTGTGNVAQTISLNVTTQ